MTDERNIKARFEQRLGTLKTVMVSLGPSAAHGCLVLRWMGVNQRPCMLRINPAGPDLDEVLAEFAERCRQTADLPEQSEPR